jgi:DNA-binding response OmpR family regulator
MDLRNVLLFIVGSEPKLAREISGMLSRGQFQTHVVSPDCLFQELEIHRPNAVILPVTTGCSPGFRICRRMRQQGRGLAVIILLERRLESLRPAALQAEADECIMHPCSERELVHRIEAVLRRRSEQSRSMSVSAELEIDVSAMKIMIRNTEIPVTVLEFRVLEYFARHRGRVVSRDALLDSIWGETLFVNSRTVDACVRRIRKKIEIDRREPALIKTLRGVGYRLDGKVKWHVMPPTQACDCAVCTGKVPSPRTRGSVAGTMVAAVSSRNSIAQPSVSNARSRGGLRN